MIRSLELKNFMAFSHLKIDFSPRINVIIGENSTGKTQLLKAAYTLSLGKRLFDPSSEINNESLEKSLTERFLRIFLPLDRKLGKMHHTGAKSKAELSLNFVNEMLTIGFHNNSQSVSVSESNNYEKYLQEPIFIPTKESLSFMEGIISLYDRYQMTFDETYRYLWNSLELPPMRPEHFHEKAEWAIAKIEDISGGKFIFHGGGRITFRSKSQNTEYSVNSMAEGFRKLGVLARLLETGAIQPGVSGPLFWDEPEGNINPQLMRLLVEILVELSRNGQQIILATHDYVFLKWFNLLCEENKGDRVRYHSLYREKESHNISIKSTDDYLEIEPNPIADTYTDLAREQLEQKLGSLTA
jgi:AAA15 family ATPase/GTPase